MIFSWKLIYVLLTVIKLQFCYHLILTNSSRKKSIVKDALFDFILNSNKKL